MKNINVEVIFYKPHVKFLFQSFLQLLYKMQSSKTSVFIYTRPELVDDLDNMIWVKSRLFIAHGRYSDLYPDKQPILIGYDLDAHILNTPEVIINLTEENINISYLNDITKLVEFQLYENGVTSEQKQNYYSKQKLKIKSFKQTIDNIWKEE